MQTVNTNISRETNKLSARMDEERERGRDDGTVTDTHPYTSDKLLIRTFIII